MAGDGELGGHAEACVKTILQHGFRRGVVCTQRALCACSGFKGKEIKALRSKVSAGSASPRHRQEQEASKE